MSKVIAYTKLSKTLTLSELKDGWWLHDETRGMNLAMRAKTEQEAFVAAITYYQRRLSEVEGEYRQLKYKVDNFLEQFEDDED